MKKSKLYSTELISSFEDFKFKKEKLLLNRKLVQTKMEFSVLNIRNRISFSGLDTIVANLKNTY